MKLFLFLLIFSVNAFGQIIDSFSSDSRGTWDYEPEAYCSNAEIKATKLAIQKVCEDKMLEFSVNHPVTCKIDEISFRSCQASCFSSETYYARLRMNIKASCETQKAYLRKTVIKYY